MFHTCSATPLQEYCASDKKVQLNALLQQSATDINQMNQHNLYVKQFAARNLQRSGAAVKSAQQFSDASER